MDKINHPYRALKWLQVLNISNNNIDNLDFVNNLAELRTLTCQDNKVDNFDELTNLATCRRLSVVDLSGNPVTRQNRYRDNVIINVGQLRLLDGKEIAKNESDFVKNWHEHKQQRIEAAISRENTKLKSRESQPEPVYHHSDISHLASGLPSGIDNLVRLIRKQHSNVEPSPSEPQFGSAREEQADLHKTFSFGVQPTMSTEPPAAQLTVDGVGGGDEDPHRVTPIPETIHEGSEAQKKPENNDMHIIPYQAN